MTPILLTVAGVATASIVISVLLAYRRAEVGFQDLDGYHRGAPPVPARAGGRRAKAKSPRRAEEEPVGVR